MMQIALSLLGRFWPYLVAGAVGFSAAWSLQGIRLDNAKAETVKVQQAFDGYKLEQKQLAYEREEEARKKREQADKEWREKYAQLQNDQDVFKRCVAAGRCGAVGVSGLPGEAGSPGIRLPTAQRLDATGTNAVPAAGESAPVLNDCAITTLMLNELQRDIANQRGY